MDPSTLEPRGQPAVSSLAAKGLSPYGEIGRLECVPLGRMALEDAEEPSSQAGGEAGGSGAGTGAGGSMGGGEGGGGGGSSRFAACGFRTAPSRRQMVAARARGRDVHAYHHDGRKLQRTKKGSNFMGTNPYMALAERIREVGVQRPCWLPLALMPAASCHRLVFGFWPGTGAIRPCHNCRHGILEFRFGFVVATGNVVQEAVEEVPAGSLTPPNAHSTAKTSFPCRLQDLPPGVSQVVLLLAALLLRLPVTPTDIGRWAADGSLPYLDWEVGRGQRGTRHLGEGRAWRLGVRRCKESGDRVWRLAEVRGGLLALGSQWVGLSGSR